VSDADPPGRPSSATPLDYLGVVLLTSGLSLLLAGVLTAFARVRTLSGPDVATVRFQLLGQAANVFIAFLFVIAIVVIVADRRQDTPRQFAAGLVLGAATASSLMLVLLAVSGVVADLSLAGTALSRLAVVATRLTTVLLSAFAMWLGATAPRATR
jgi:riboflavin transporter FmnP